MPSAFPTTAELAPHAPPMLLVDRLVGFEGNRQRTEAVVSADNPFFVPGRGLPSYVGFELMAQSISIFDGMQRRDAGESPAIGFLLGCRRYRTTRDWFEEGERLMIEVVSLIDDGEMRSFDCQISGPYGEVFATGTINVFRPNDAQAYLAEARGHG